MRLRIVTIVGARPQFIKCAAVSRVLRGAHDEFLLHTGQHFDYGMSQVFFEQLGIPEPDINLNIAGGSHGEMTARMLEGIERVLIREKPEWVLVYGDTNSTLAAALAASKLHIPVAHVEAGLRSFNRRMPEEINRVLTDHLATLLLCPTHNAVELLQKEGVTRGVHNVGDVMFDSVLSHRDRARERVDRDALFRMLDFETDAQGRYALATLHRPENTDHLARLRALVEGLSAIGLPVLLPLHPRTKNVLATAPDLRGSLGANVRVVDPLGYLELLRVASDATVVLTDSGGLQKEAFFLGVRCVTMRDETEWIETVEAGANEIVGADKTLLIAAAARAVARGPLAASAASPFGDGHAAEKIVRALESR